MTRWRYLIAYEGEVEADDEDDARDMAFASSEIGAAKTTTCDLEAIPDGDN